MRVKRNAFQLDDFSTRLQETRKSVEPKQAKFAQKLGITQNTLSCFEKGAKKPSLDMLIMLSDALDVSTDYLLFGKDTASAIQTPKTAGDIARLIAKVPDLGSIKIGMDGSSLDIELRKVPPQLLTFCSKFSEFKKKSLDDETSELFEGWLENQFQVLDGIPLMGDNAVIQFPTSANEKAEIIAQPSSKKEKVYMVAYDMKQPRPIRIKDVDACCIEAPDNKSN